MRAAVGSGDLDAMLKRLHLPTIRRLHGELAIQAEAEGTSYHDFLEILAAEEIAHRARPASPALRYAGAFPPSCDRPEDSTSPQTSVRAADARTLLGPELAQRGPLRDLLRPARARQDALCFAVAYRAIRNVLRGTLHPADELIGALSPCRACRAAGSGAGARTSTRTCLVIDELG